jgi:hypothetical protein
MIANLSLYIIYYLHIIDLLVNFKENYTIII